MIEVLSLKAIEENPADGISNFIKAVFGKKHSEKIVFIAKCRTKEGVEAIKKCRFPLMHLIVYKPDILWGTGSIKDIAALIVKPRKTKYIINFHTVLKRTSTQTWKVRTPWRIRRWIFSKASLVITPSRYSAQSINTYLPHIPTKEILNGVDVDFFDPKKNDKEKVEHFFKTSISKPIITFIGSMHWRKRPELVVEIAKEMPEAQFVMIGKEVGEFDIKRAVDQTKNILWSGRMAREEIAVVLASSVAFLFPSKDDAAAAVILEAMASGCVPVVTDSGGSGEFFDNKHEGISIPPDSREKQEFVKALKDIIDNPSTRNQYSGNARKKACEQEWSKVLKRYSHAIISEMAT
ncbi:MAG: hypothetical protein RIQ54_446 [Candidatus Parcubacteria bacterium]|jgi:glycosyltransferase involved in cell wall biosynthesis